LLLFHAVSALSCLMPQTEVQIMHYRTVRQSVMHRKICQRKLTWLNLVAVPG